MQKITTKLLALIIISGFLYACNDNKEDAKTEEEVLTEEIISPENNDKVDYILPSPLQIVELFKSAGLTYIGGITNPISNANTYNSKYDQKLNMGIYSADMVYCTINNQTQESINYLNTLRKISEKLWMTDILNSIGVSSRLEANIGNEDSLTYIMSDMQMQMDDYLDENGISNTGTIIFAGAWVETMYLGSKINTAKRNDKLISRISEQAIILGNLIASIKQTDEDNEYGDFITDLENINKHFSRFDSESEEDYLLNDDEVTSLSVDISALRNKLTGNK